MKIRTMLALICMLLICFVIAGCIDMQSTAVINSDGSVDYKQQVMSVEMLAKELKEGQAEFQNKHPGATIKAVSDGNMQGYEVVVHYNSIEEMVKDEGNLFKRTRGKSVGVQRKEFWLFDAYNVDILLEGFSDNSKSGDGWDNLSRAMLSQVKLGLSISLPYKPEFQNADNVTDDGKTLYWNIASALTDNNSKEIKAQFRIWNKKNIFIFAVVSLLLVVFCGLALYTISKKGAGSVHYKTSIMCLIISILGLAAFSTYSLLPAIKDVSFENNDIISPAFSGESVNQMGKAIFKEEKKASDSSSSKTANNSSKTEASLGDIDIGMLLSDVSNKYGTDWKVTGLKSGAVSYKYPGKMEVIVRDNKVIGLVSDSDDVHTKSGLKQGDFIEDVIRVHGEPQLKTEYNGLLLYEYEKNSFDNRACWLRYAIKNGIVDYISIRYKD